MSAIIYYIALPFLYLFSVLPSRILYIISDALYIILYHLAGYRKKVVLENLRNSFPNKSEDEINAICKKFYRHLCDIFLETFKVLTISKEQMLKRCSMHPGAKALFDKLANEKRNSNLVFGHYGNWEWGGHTFSLSCQQQCYAIYHPLRNKYFDGLIYRMRTRFGIKMIAMKDTYREMLRHRDELNATVFIADQSPSNQNAHWTTFLQQDTAVLKGSETIAKKLNYAVVYVSIKKIRRGYYQFCAELICDNPAVMKEGEITELHTRCLERDIIAMPETWLWSHRRWKQKRVIS